MYRYFLLLCLWSSSGKHVQALHNDVIHKLSRVNGDFALRLYDQLVSQAPGKNIIFSPVSVSTLFAITYFGARGVTRRQLGDILGFNHLAPGDDLNEAYRHLLHRLNSRLNNCTLLLTCGIFIHRGFSIYDRFINNTLVNYNAVVEPMDFAKQPELSRSAINDWVQNKTNGEIEDLLPRGSVNALSQLILTSVVYFNGNWEFPFKFKDTEIKPFSLAANVREDMVMMNIKRKFRYADVPEFGCKILEIPYSTGAINLYILLPDDISGLPNLESKIEYDRLNSIIQYRIIPREVTLTLPMFKISQEISLRSSLGAMGLTELFSLSESDLSGLTESAELFVSEVAHVVTLEVTEEGTESASGIGQIIALSAERPTEFRVDRPFMFFIHHRATRTILFLGRIIRPPTGTDTIGEFVARKLALLNHSNFADYSPCIVSICLLVVIVLCH